MGKSKTPYPADSLAARDRSKGLLDFDASHEASDMAALEALPTDQALGLPPFMLTASRETLLAYIAILLEGASAAGAKVRRARGRQATVFSLWNTDAKRAWIIWWYIRQRQEAGSGAAETMTVAQLIKEVRLLPEGHKLFFNDRSDSTNLEQSISRGKKKLGIDKNWVSEACEKMLPLKTMVD